MKPETWPCNRCARVKPFAPPHYEPMASRRWGLDKICHECRKLERRDYMRRRRGGSSAAPGGACAVCDGGDRLRVDRTGATLCFRCMGAAGLLNRNPDRAIALVEYLVGLDPEPVDLFS